MADCATAYCCPHCLQVSDFRWLPSLEALGGSPSRAALAVISALPVITMSLVCHYQIHPLVRLWGALQHTRAGESSVCTLVSRKSLIFTG